FRAFAILRVNSSIVPCGHSCCDAARFSAASGFEVASCRHASQQRNTGRPESITLIGTPIEPRRLLGRTAQDRCFSARARSVSDSLFNAASTCDSELVRCAAGVVGAFFAGTRELRSSRTFAAVFWGSARAVGLQPSQQMNTVSPSRLSLIGFPID